MKWLKAKLEQVFGTTASCSSITVNQQNGLVAYPAGSTIVLLNPQTHEQAFLIGPSKNNISCLSFSPNSRWIVTGENGCDPHVRIWEINDYNQFQGQHLVELKYHKHGIVSVKFIKESNFVVSIGNPHDKSVVVWNWKTNEKLCESRLTSQVNAMDVNDASTTFVTVGVRHVKFWNFEANKNLEGRSAILGGFRNNTFVGVCCTLNDRSFSITNSRQIIEFLDKKLVNVFSINDNVPYSICCSSGSDLFIGFNNGIINLVDIQSKNIIVVISQPHSLGLDIETCRLADSFADHNLKFPGVVQCVYYKKSKILTVLYNDNSIYHWFVDTDKKTPVVKIISSQLNHVGTIFDIEVSRCTNLQCFKTACFTCGADETIRIWKMGVVANCCDSKELFHEPNLLSLNLRKIIYIGKNTDLLTKRSEKSASDVTSIESQSGLRSLKLGFKSKHLACGGKNGNIYVFDVSSVSLNKLMEIDAHDSEVLCLEYSDTHNRSESGCLLVSGSRDRLVHLFDVARKYAYLATVAENSASISTLKFMPQLVPHRFELITFGIDKLVVLWEIHAGDSLTNRVGQIATKHNPCCMDSTVDGRILMGCQDRQIRIYSKDIDDEEPLKSSYKVTKTFGEFLNQKGMLSKICLDPSEKFIACVFSDRYVYIVDIANGDIVAFLGGQSDCITSIRFSSDLSRLFIVSSNGCIFVWRLPRFEKKDCSRCTIWAPVSKETTKRRSSNLFEKFDKVDDKEINNGNEQYFSSKLFSTEQQKSQLPFDLNYVVCNNALLNQTIGLGLHQNKSSLPKTPTIFNSSPAMRHSSVTDTSKVKLIEAREKLRKSRENLSVVGFNSHATQNNISSITRSNSIGDLLLKSSSNSNKFEFCMTADKSNKNQKSALLTGDGGSCNTKLLNERRRSIAKSFCDLSNLGNVNDIDSTNLNCRTMKSQYNNPMFSKLSGSRQRLEESLQNFKKISLTNLSSELDNGINKPFDKASSPLVKSETNFVNSPASLNQFCISNSGKNIRRGVQKKLTRQPSKRQRHSKLLIDAVNRDDQTTTSGESDSYNPETGVNILRPDHRNFSDNPKSLSKLDIQKSSICPVLKFSSHVLLRKAACSKSFGADELVKANSKITYIFNSSVDESKKMAKHVSDCVRDMTLVSDKITNAHQLLLSNDLMPSEERIQLICSLNDAIAIFRQRFDQILSLEIHEK